ncbi:hypothetical protein [Nesterenkonia alba]|uniref:hypothetical protein n=1 Tax=Nesterenkonia alba TaxID=515814 RepID=UPI0003B40409|nr:hypothetical protein [Nesterenkonia alba]
MSTDSSPGSFLARALLVTGVVVTTVAFLALLTVLGLYFAEQTPHPGLYWVLLWGFPVGFLLMIGYMLLNLRSRRAVR